MYTLTFQSLSEEACSVLLPVLATVVMRRGKKLVICVAQCLAVSHLYRGKNRKKNRTSFVSRRSLKRQRKQSVVVLVVIFVLNVCFLFAFLNFGSYVKPAAAHVLVVIVKFLIYDKEAVYPVSVNKVCFTAPSRGQSQHHQLLHLAPRVGSGAWNRPTPSPGWML